MNEREVLGQALQLEEDGLSFYRAAAERTKDPETATMFRSLAEDEVDHAGYIRRQLASLDGGGGFVAVPELDTIEALDKGAPIFPKGKQAPKSLPANPNDEEALLFGLSAETKSYELYTTSAARIANPDAKNMFVKLAAVERGHFDLLMMRYEARYGYPR